MTLEKQLEEARSSMKYHLTEADKQVSKAELFRRLIAMLEAEIATVKALEPHDLPEMRRELRESADIPVAPVGMEE